MTENVLFKIFFYSVQGACNLYNICGYDVCNDLEWTPAPGVPRCLYLCTVTSTPARLLTLLLFAGQRLLLVRNLD